MTEKAGSLVQEYQPKYRWTERTLHITTPSGKTVEWTHVNPTIFFEQTSEVFMHETGGQIRTQGTII